MSKMTNLTRRTKVVAGFVFATAFVTIAAPNAFAQGQPHPAAPSGVAAPKILVIDKVGVFGGSKVGQDLNHQAQKAVISMNEDLKSEAQGLQKERAALEQQVAILAPDVKNQKIKAFQAKAGAFQQKAIARRMQIQYGVMLARQQINKALEPIIKGIMQERGANLLLDRSVIIFGTDGSLDVTQTAVQRLDQKLPAVTLQLVTPPAPIAQQMMQQMQQGGQ
jgi:Skp family chaperone for outer membrane proteins